MAVYLAQPQGDSVVAFKQSQAGATSVRFENLTHDFPTLAETARSA